MALERACAPDAEHCLEADIGSEAALARAMGRFREQYGRRIASVIHLAAYYDFSGEEHPAYRDVNVEGTRRLLHALGPKWPYPRSKVLAERGVLEEHGDMPVVFLRIAGVYTKQGEVPSLTMQIQRINERQWNSRLFPSNPAIPASATIRSR